MPKIPGLRKRKDAFFIGRAIPKDLQGKGPYVTQSGRPQREIVRTLGTSDLKVARKRVHAEWAAMDREFETERFKLANPHLESRELAARVKDLQRGDLKTVRLENLDPRTEAFRFFVELERDSEEGIPELVARSDEDRLREILEELRQDAASLVGVSRGLYDDDGLEDFEGYLERKGLVADPNSSGLQKFADFFRRARLENVRRDINRIQRLPVTEGDPDFRAAPLLATANGKLSYGSPSSVTPRKTVGELVDTFLEHGRKAGRSTGTTRTYGTPARVMKGYFGEDKPLREIGTEEVRGLLDFLERYPKNAAQRYSGLSIIEAARAAEKSGSTDLMSKRSISNVFGVIAVILNHAKHLGWIESNPASNPIFTERLKEKGRKRQKDQFTVEQLRALFSAPLYTGCQNDWTGFNKRGPNHPRRGRFWVPLLGLFHGMRLNECCQLFLKDIDREDGVDVIRVTLGETDEEREVKRLKTGASERTVPIHPELIRIGFLEFVAERRRAGDSLRLFPELPINEDGFFSDGFSRWFTSFVKQTVGPRCKARFHDFRHMVRDALREAGTDDARVNRIQGWEEGRGMQARYGNGFKASTLLQEVEKVAYPGLDLSHLYVEGKEINPPPSPRRRRRSRSGER